MNVCACKTKLSKESMRQNAHQHDSGIDPLVLQMLMPFHRLHLLLFYWCSQMLLPPRCLYLLLSHWSSHILPPPHFIQRLLCHWCSQMLLLIQLCTRCSTCVAHAVTQMYTVPQPLAHPSTYRVWGPGARGDGALQLPRAHWSAPEVCGTGECIVYG